MEGEVSIGISFASEARIIVAFEVQPTEERVAEPLIAKTEDMIPQSPWPLWVSDGFDSYGEALFQKHCLWKTFHKTGRVGRPKEPTFVPDPRLRYVQAVKIRDRYRHVIGIKPRVVFGRAKKSEITIWCLERQNLNFRQENRRFARKTIAFSKSIRGMENQLAFYQGYFIFIRLHWCLRISWNQPGPKKWQRLTPAMAAGISDHPWTLKEFLCYKIPLN